MDSRPNLQDIFEDLLESPNVYFQPPTSKRMHYPAIKYKLTDMDTKHADNLLYSKMNCYEVILIDEDPESEFVDKLINLPLCSFVRPYTADNLNHWVYRIYY